VPVSFLGQRLYVTPMPARLAKKTGCAVVPLLSLLNRERYFEMIFLPSLFYEGDLDHPEFVTQFMQKIFTSMEPFVLRDPAQWHCWPFLKILKLPATERPTEFIHRTEM
jgi:lauroyl/myristoyl acyltransferase